jgi:hypothetical protein
MIEHTQPTFHFALVSPGGDMWRTGTDLQALMETMNKLKYTYWVWYVPGPESAFYNFEWYQPQVEGSFVLAHVEFNKRGRVIKQKEEATV